MDIYFQNKTLEKMALNRNKCFIKWVMIKSLNGL